MCVSLRLIDVQFPNVLEDRRDGVFSSFHATSTRHFVVLSSFNPHHPDTAFHVFLALLLSVFSASQRVIQALNAIRLCLSKEVKYARQAKYSLYAVGWIMFQLSLQIFFLRFTTITDPLHALLALSHPHPIFSPPESILLYTRRSFTEICSSP
jgi:hypothetical protein